MRIVSEFSTDDMNSSTFFLDDGSVESLELRNRSMPDNSCSLIALSDFNTKSTDMQTGWIIPSCNARALGAGMKYKSVSACPRRACPARAVARETRPHLDSLGRSTVKRISAVAASLPYMVVAGFTRFQCPAALTGGLFYCLMANSYVSPSLGTSTGISKNPEIRCARNVAASVSPRTT